MAQNKSSKTNQFKIDATTPFYAVVGMTDVAVEFARTAVADAQERLSQLTQADLNDGIDALASRGKQFVNRVRNQQSTQDTKAAATTTVAKARTTKTQTSKAAASAASATKKTAGTAKRSAKATGTTAKKTGAAATKAAGDTAAKLGD
jgi:hypothetical protein